MIRIIKNGEDRRRIFKFTCSSCGCEYEATEDEGARYESGPIMWLECPMAFCRTNNLGTVVTETAVKKLRK